MKIIIAFLFAVFTILPFPLCAQVKKDRPEDLRKQMNEQQELKFSKLLQKRIRLIKDFAATLSEDSEDAWSARRSDSVARVRLYQSTLKKFFKSSVRVFEYGFQSPIFSFDKVVSMLGKDSLILRPPDPATDTLIVAKDHPDYFANTIILYFAMHDREFEGMYFAFKKNTAELIDIIPAGGQPAVYREKKKFLNDLHKDVLPARDWRIQE